MKSKKLFVLAGINHSGKTTLGRALAKDLNCNFFDTDLETERLTGKHPAVHSKEGGQTAYNFAEYNTIKTIIKEIENSEDYTVVSTGGGFCDNPEGWQFIKNYGYIVWLNADLEVGAERVIEDARKRISNGGTFKEVPRYPGYKEPVNSFEDIRKMYFKFITPQIKRYKNLCDIEVKVSDTSVEKNLDVLKKELGL